MVIESLWKAKCTIRVRVESTDPITKRIKFTETVTYTDQACRLSFETIKQTSAANNAAVVVQLVKLFISPEVVIHAGSRITVTQNGITGDYQQSGKPAVYTNHQEVVLELFKGWA